MRRQSAAISPLEGDRRGPVNIRIYETYSFTYRGKYALHSQHDVSRGPKPKTKSLSVSHAIRLLAAGCPKVFSDLETTTLSRML